MRRFAGLAAALIAVGCTSEIEPAPLVKKRAAPAAVAESQQTLRALLDANRPAYPDTPWVKLAAAAPHDAEMISALIRIFHAPDSGAELRTRALAVMRHDRNFELEKFWPTVLDDPKLQPEWTELLLEKLTPLQFNAQAQLLLLLGSGKLDDVRVLEYLAQRKALSAAKLRALIEDHTGSEQLRAAAFRLLTASRELTPSVISAAAEQEPALIHLVAERLASACDPEQAPWVVTFIASDDPQLQRLGMKGAATLLQTELGRKALEAAFEKTPNARLKNFLARRAFSRGNLRRARELFADEPLELAAIALLTGELEVASSQLALAPAGKQEVMVWPGQEADLPRAVLDAELGSQLLVRLHPREALREGAAKIPLELILENRGKTALTFLSFAIHSTRVGAAEVLKYSSLTSHDGFQSLQQVTIKPGEKHREPFELGTYAISSGQPLLSAEFFAVYADPKKPLEPIYLQGWAGTELTVK